MGYLVKFKFVAFILSQQYKNRKPVKGLRFHCLHNCK